MRGKLVAVALVIAVLGACGGGDDDDATDPTTTTTEAGPTKADAAAHVLLLEDFASADALDAKWEEGDVTAGVPIELPACIDEELQETDTTALAKFVTVNEFHLPSVDQRVTAYAGDGAAEAFDAAVARLDGCAEPEFIYDGAPAKGTTLRLDLPAAGDRSQAWRTTVTIAGAQVSITTMHVVQDDLEMSIVHTDIAQPDQAKLEALLEKATARLA